MWQSTPLLVVVVVVVLLLQLVVVATGFLANADCPWSKAPRRTATHVAFIVSEVIA